MKGIGNLGNLMKQAQKMKAEMERLQAEAGAKTVEGSAGGGMVMVTANGRGDLVAVRIDPEVAKAEELEMLQDLVVAAANDALGKAREVMSVEMNKLAGGLNLPGLF